jgi:hypothetical protein
MKIFIDDLIKEFNEARTNPRNYILKIKSHMKYIKRFQGITVYENDDYPKVILNKGDNAFTECIKMLEKHRRIPELKYCEEITIKVPDKVEEMNNKEKLAESLIAKRNEIKDTYTGLSFHYDHSYLDSEISALLQIIDDTNTNSKRRNNILNLFHEYIGVSVGRNTINGRYMVYITFAKGIGNDN